MTVRLRTTIRSASCTTFTPGFSSASAGSASRTIRTALLTLTSAGTICIAARSANRQPARPDGDPLLVVGARLPRPAQAFQCPGSTEMRLPARGIQLERPGERLFRRRVVAIPRCERPEVDEGGGEVRIELSCLLEECARGGHVLALQRQQPEAVRDPGILRIELSRVVERRLGEADVSLVAFDGGEIAIRIGIARMSLQHLADHRRGVLELAPPAQNGGKRVQQSGIGGVV